MIQSCGLVLIQVIVGQSGLTRTSRAELHVLMQRDSNGSIEIWRHIKFNKETRRAVTGFLQTGIYIGQAVNFPGEYATVTDDVSKFALTENPQSDSVKFSVLRCFSMPTLFAYRGGWKWYVEEIGDGLFRCKHESLNVSPVILPGQDMAVGLREGTSDWTVKETDVPGEYSIRLCFCPRRKFKVNCK